MNEMRSCGNRLALGSVGILALACGVMPAAAQCTGFNLTQTTGATIVAGTADIGNHGDDIVTNITLPFAVAIYGASYTSANVSSNGTIQFATNSNSWSNACLPQAGTIGVAICPHWDDLRTDGAGNGILTSISGVAPQPRVQHRVASGLLLRVVHEPEL